MADIKISVIVPVYNAEEFLKDTLDSLLAQTLQELEIICVDDLSTDNSLEILKEYEKKDPKIIVLQSPKKTLGPGNARNFGLYHAKGEYIYFGDADDIFETDMLEKTYFQAKKTESDIVLFDAISFDTLTKEITRGENRFLIRKYLPDKEVFSLEDIEKFQLNISCGVSWICLYRHDFLRHENIIFIENASNEDLVFSYLTLALAKKITTVKSYFVRYRQGNPHSSSATRDKWPDCGYKAFKILKDELINRGVFSKYEKSFANCALKSVLSDVDWTCQPNAFHEIYMIGKEKCVPEFGIDRLDGEDIISEEFKIKRDLIMHCSPEEYLINLKGYLRTRNRNNYIEKVLGIPFGKDEPIAIYGAGAKGIEWFTFLYQRRYRVIKWVDKKAEEIGFPISSPDSLKETEICSIIIAIEDKAVVEQVCTYLENIGIDRKMIYCPYNKK